MHKKILFCATVDYHFKAFHLPYMEWFKKQGWEVHIAANGDMVLPFVDKKYNLPIARSPFDHNNLEAFNSLKSIIKENKYKIVHCHTPVGGVLARLASQDARSRGTKVIYTAHGFHFCKGGSFTNWMIYYPIEKWLAGMTDCLVTINEEDYHLATTHRFKAGQINHIHGVGVDTDLFTPVSKEKKLRLREALGFKPNDFIMFYAAEFNKNKNQSQLIKALASIKKNVPNARLVFAGEGKLFEECRELAVTLKVENMVHFLGYRKDIEQLLKAADIAVASSSREGLPVNIMESMACGLPIIASQNRGHSELVEDRKNGFIIPRGDDELFGKRIKELYDSKQLRKWMGTESRKKVVPYSLANVGVELGEIYSAFMMEDSNEAESEYYRSSL
ncbi:glycosyltransferase family 4 protein [Mesobacillus foraminis]|uniref:glycosyltransferase family 4 protein n=1 Tax=Mesobacillus foraminis TaxID=279826 RepID=UPI0039A24230